MPRRRAADAPETPEELQRAMNAQFGADAMLMASDPRLRITRIPTGVLTVDMKLKGGLPKGRHIEIFGPFSVGKSYLATSAIASAQAMGENGYYFDNEKGFDPEHAERIGVDLDLMGYSRQRNHGHEVIDMMEMVIRSRLYKVIVLDSIASLLPKGEFEKSIAEGNLGTQQAMLMSRALRKLTAALDTECLIFINQTREAVGTMFGPRTTTSGGRSMGFYAGTRLELVRTESIKKNIKVMTESGDAKEQKVVVGHRSLVRVEKDKTGGARRMATTSMVFRYDTGMHDHVEDLILLGREHNLIGKRGNVWWVEGYEDEAKNSRPKFKTWLRRNIAVQDDLEEAIWATLDDEAQEVEEDD